MRAQIERNLIPVWRQAIVENPDWELQKWSAAHWALIARLPAALQHRPPKLKAAIETFEEDAVPDL